MAKVRVKHSALNLLFIVEINKTNFVTRIYPSIARIIITEFLLSLNESVLIQMRSITLHMTSSHVFHFIFNNTN